MPQIRAILFDFDGLILDTEYACFSSWQAVFREFGQEYTLDDYLKIVGTHQSLCDPRNLLEERCGHPVDRDAVDRDRIVKERRFAADLVVLPGVRELVALARERGFKRAVVSNSSQSWVRGHLLRHGIFDAFNVMVGREDASQLKPAPDLYLEAIRQLGILPQHGLAFEDSQTGSLAAIRAGLHCIAVPNAITAVQDFSHIATRLASLAEFDLDAFLLSRPSANEG